MGRPAYTIERFWDRVRVGPLNECWPWLGPFTAKGYGKQIEWVELFGDKGMRPHRVAYFLAHGELNDDLMILHRCDNPPCCNPAHLRDTTHQANIQDAIAKGRLRLGGRTSSTWAGGGRRAKDSLRTVGPSHQNTRDDPAG